MDDPEPGRLGRIAMGRLVGDFTALGREWRLVVQCTGACRVRYRLVADLVSQVPADLTWADVEPKLRCSQCDMQADIVGLSGPPQTPGQGSTWLLLQRGVRQWRN